MSSKSVECDAPSLVTTLIKFSYQSLIFIINHDHKLRAQPVCQEGRVHQRQIQSQQDESPHHGSGTSSHSPDGASKPSPHPASLAPYPCSPQP